MCLKEIETTNSHSSDHRIVVLLTWTPSKKYQPLRFSTGNRLPRCPRCISLLPDIAVAVDPRQHPQVGRRTKTCLFSCQDSLLWDVFMVVYDLRPNQKLCAMFSIDHPRFSCQQILNHPYLPDPALSAPD